MRVLADSRLGDWISFKFSYDKCMYTDFPPKGKVKNNPSHVIWMDDHKAKFFRQIKYLNVVFHWDHSWMPHLDFLQVKTTKDQYKLNRIVIVTWRIRPEVCKVVYLVVAEHVIFYAAPISYSNKVSLYKRLLNFQHASCYGSPSVTARCQQMRWMFCLNVPKNSEIVLNANS